jgi:hypothetical protein
VEELITEFLQIVGQARMDRKTASDHRHLIEYFRKALEPRLSRRILFSDNVPKTIDGWMNKAIQYNMNWRMGNLFLNQDTKASLSKKSDTNKSNGNAHWWRTTEKKDPNAIDINALTMEERATLLRQGKCFCCKKTGHMAKDCPPLEQEKPLSRRRWTQQDLFTPQSKRSPRSKRKSLQRWSWKIRMRRIFETENWINISVSQTIY